MVLKRVMQSGRVAPIPGGEFEFSDEQRRAVRAVIAPHLRDQADVDKALQRTQESLRQYQEWTQIAEQLAPGDRKTLVSELHALEQAATGYLRAVGGLSEEAIGRLTDVYEMSPPFDDDLEAGAGSLNEPTYGHLVHPERFIQARRTVSKVAGRAGMVARDVAEENRKGGRKRNGPARDACERMADIWQELTGLTLHPDGGDHQRRGKFGRYFKTAINCVEPTLDGRHVVREVAERRGQMSGQNATDLPRT